MESLRRKPEAGPELGLYVAGRSLEAKLELGPGQIPENERKYKIEPVGEPLSLDNQPLQSRSGGADVRTPLRRPDDATCGFEILEDFQRFNLCNSIYARATWDPRIRSRKASD